MAKTRQEILDLISQLQEELRQVGSNLRSKQYIGLVTAQDFVKAMKLFSNNATTALDKLNFPQESRRVDQYASGTAIFQNIGYAGFKYKYLDQKFDIVMVGYNANTYNTTNGFQIGDKPIGDIRNEDYYYNYNYNYNNFCLIYGGPPKKNQKYLYGDPPQWVPTQYIPMIKYDERENR